MVSVCCITYNQEKYIRRCLDGLVNQVCSFKYEIIVHDDASTDNTSGIVLEYADKYPDLIHPIIQTENQYSKGIIISSIIIKQAKGKYCAICEGDDFWTDPHKLEKQVEAMERNPSCHICLHSVQGVNEDETPNGIMYPNFKIDTGVISGERLLDYICTNEYVFQTTSFFMKTDDLKEFFNNPPEFRRVSATGDTPYLLFFSTIGDVYYISDTMSCYRHTDLEHNTRKAKYMNTEEKIVAHYNKQIHMMEEFDKYTNGKFHELCQRKIDGYFFDKAVRNQDYKELCKKKYGYFKKRWTKKERLYVIISAYFPFFHLKKRNK